MRFLGPLSEWLPECLGERMQQLTGWFFRLTLHVFVGESPQWAIWGDALQLAYSISRSSNCSINTCFLLHNHTWVVMDSLLLILVCFCSHLASLGALLNLLVNLHINLEAISFSQEPCSKKHHLSWHISTVGTKDAGTRSVYISCPSFYQQWHNSDAAPTHGSIACINRELCRKCGEFLFWWCHSARIWLYLFETCWVCVSWFSCSIQCIRSSRSWGL